MIGPEDGSYVIVPHFPGTSEYNSFVNGYNRARDYYEHRAKLEREVLYKKNIEELTALERELVKTANQAFSENTDLDAEIFKLKDEARILKKERDYLSQRLANAERCIDEIKQLLTQQRG